MKKPLLILSSILVVGCSSNKDRMTVSGNVDGLMKGTLYLQAQEAVSYTHLTLPTKA